MKAKKIITIVLTVIIFVTAAFLGVSAVYRVEEVTLIVQNVSSPALEEAAQLKVALEEAYLKKSTIKADDLAAKTAFESFAYFRLTGFEKDYPGRLVITATEDEETYAVAYGENYVIFSGDGTRLSERALMQNRADGTNNLLVSSAAVNLSANFCNTAIFRLLNTLDGLFCGIRGNVVKAELVRRADLVVLVRLYFREGVQAAVYTPDENAQAKANALYECYTNGLTVAERTAGVIVVSRKAKATYQPKNYLDNEFSAEENDKNE